MTFLYEFRYVFGLTCQNVLNLIFFKSQMCPIWGQSGTIWMPNSTSGNQSDMRVALIECIGRHNVGILICEGLQIHVSVTRLIFILRT